MDYKNKSFFQRVYKVVRKIPFGKVTTYGLIANYLGAFKSARMVGYAMNSSHKYSDIPAHRVVNRNGLLTGRHHFSGSLLMQELLENEGAIVIDNKIENFYDILWDPSVKN
tara:strand:+ start:103 stop:435 length:333 start_codon:yes stop_codon:yes gene_type:complete